MAGELILIVEDDADIRESLREALEIEGYRVTTAENGQCALDLLDRIRPRAILLDLMMPILDGWGFLKRFRQRADGADVPVIVISALADRAVSLPVQARLQKPVSLDALFETLQSLATGGGG